MWVSGSIEMTQLTIKTRVALLVRCSRCVAGALFAARVALLAFLFAARVAVLAR